MLVRERWVFFSLKLGLFPLELSSGGDGGGDAPGCIDVVVDYYFYVHRLGFFTFIIICYSSLTQLVQ